MGRVVQDYAHGLYYPAAQHHQRLMSGGAAAASELSGWKRRVREQWPGVGLRRLGDTPRELPRAGALDVRIAAMLNGLTPGDVRVEFVAQRVLPRSKSELPALSSFRSDRHDDAWRALLRPSGEVEADGSTVYVLHALPPNCGQFAFEIRIFPWHEMLAHPLEMGLLRRL
jgi:starch phosphorylase